MKARALSPAIALLLSPTASSQIASPPPSFRLIMGTVVIGIIPKQNTMPLCIAPTCAGRIGYVFIVVCGGRQIKSGLVPFILYEAIIAGIQRWRLSNL